jgi:hypothetical protein
MNMYIARSEGGTFKVVKNLGHIEPQEGEVGCDLRGADVPGPDVREHLHGRVSVSRQVFKSPEIAKSPPQKAHAG